MSFYEYDGMIVDQVKLDPSDHNRAIIRLNDGEIVDVDYWTTRLIGGMCYVALQELDLDFEWKMLRR
jgi:hypothetical protein